MNDHKYISQIITIQKCVRAYLKNLIIPSHCQTKEWRKTRTWYKGGKSNECEKYQINLIEKMLAIKLMKTHVRINMENYEITTNTHPMKNNDGFEWTENFDGLLIKNTSKYYFNLKFVCDGGGAQTRSLREVYHFIRCQMEYLIKFDTTNTYFINILDGDECFHAMNKFLYLFNKEKYKQVIKYVFIGSLYDFKKKMKLLIV